jgi:hypothetical protein
MSGCCVHVACFIYYLSHAKFNSIKPPAEHLNSIFVQMSQKNPPNEPNYIRNSRRSKKAVTEPKNLISSDSDSSRNSDTESYTNKCELIASTTKRKKKNDKQKIENEKENKLIKVQINHSFDNRYNNTDNAKITIENIIAALSPYVPFWGGKINYRAKLIQITNTCTIDNLLFAFWVASFLDCNILNLSVLDRVEIRSRIFRKKFELFLIDPKKCSKWIEFKVGSKKVFKLYRIQSSIQARKQLNIILFLNKLNQNSKISAEEFFVLVKIDREN